MSDLTIIEKFQLERFLAMEGGYVLNFSNNRLQNFIMEVTGLNIYDDKYNYGSGSKANRIRAFWTKEPNYLVGKLLDSFLDYWKVNLSQDFDGLDQRIKEQYNSCVKISNRLKQGSPIEQIDAIQSNLEEKDFSLLANSIRDSINRNEPGAAIDRLHTFVVKYIRTLYQKHGITLDSSKPLHSIFGEYVKYLRQNGIIESDMTERILKMSISIMESFNDVRNNQSLAHDNPALNYDESILIFNNISNTIRFIETIEAKISDVKGDDAEFDYDLPF